MLIRFIKTCLGRNYLNYKQRASLSEFWIWKLCLLIVFSFLNLIHLELLGLILYYLILPADICITIRRLHDMNISGKLIFIPILSFLLLNFDMANEFKIICAYVFIFSTLIIYLILCIKGNDLPNKYGYSYVWYQQRFNKIFVFYA